MSSNSGSLSTESPSRKALEKRVLFLKVHNLGSLSPSSQAFRFTDDTSPSRDSRKGYRGHALHHLLPPPRPSTSTSSIRGRASSPPSCGRQCLCPNSCVLNCFRSQNASNASGNSFRHIGLDHHLSFSWAILFSAGRITLSGWNQPTFSEWKKGFASVSQ